MRLTTDFSSISKEALNQGNLSFVVSGMLLKQEHNNIITVYIFSSNVLVYFETFREIQDFANTIIL